MDYEEEMFRAKVCGKDVGDINLSPFYVKKIDAICEEVSGRLKGNMTIQLDGTDEKNLQHTTTTDCQDDTTLADRTDACSCCGCS